MWEKAGFPDPTRRIRLDVASAAPKASAAALMSPRELRELLSLVGMGPASLFTRPSLWRPLPPCHWQAATVAAAQAASDDAWAADTLAGLAEKGCLVLDNGSIVGVGSFAFIAAEDLSASAASEADPSEFESLKREFAEVLAGPSLGLLSDSGPEFELHIETGKATLPRS